MSLFKKVTGELTFDKFYLFMINYKWIETLSVSQHRKIVRPTMSTIISNFNNDANFGIEFQSGMYVFQLFSVIDIRILHSNL